MREAAAAAELERRLAPVRQVARAIFSHGFRVTRPQFGFQQTGDTALPWLDDSGMLHFAAMLFYPEVNPYHDTIQDCSENDTIGAHLDEVRCPSRLALSCILGRLLNKRLLNNREYMSSQCSQRASNQPWRSDLDTSIWCKTTQHVRHCRCLAQTRRRCRGTTRGTTRARACASTTARTWARC